MNRSRPLEIDGDLTLRLDAGTPTRVRAADNSIFIDFASLGTARTLVACLPRGARREAAGSLFTSFLSRSDLTVEARLRGRRVASLSGRSRGSWIGKRMGLPGVELSLPRLVLAALLPGRPA